MHGSEATLVRCAKGCRNLPTCCVKSISIVLRIRWTTLSKIRLGNENFVRRILCPVCLYKSQAKVEQSC